MSLFSRNTDPLNQKALELNAEIARLEKEIRQLSEPAPKRRFTALDRPLLTHSTGRSGPKTSTPDRSGAVTATASPRSGVSRKTSSSSPFQSSASETFGPLPIADDHYNPEGIRKFDLAGLVNKIMEHFKGPSPTSMGMATLLAAGSVQGLRPLRYEKRVARNRFIGLFFLLTLILLGLARVYWHQP
jgi:hypothetical protein